MITCFAQLVEQASAASLRHAVIVHPTTADSLRGANLVQERSVAQCSLIGDAAAVQTLAVEHSISISGLTLIDEPDSETAIRRALHLCHQGEADLLVSGDGTPPFLLGAALLDQSQGLPNGSTLSGVSVVELESPNRLLLVTDGWMVVAPDLEQRIGIVENAVRVAHRLGIETPRVALVSAAETVNPKSPSTVDAAQITVMAQRRQIRGAIIDGPLGLDNAVSASAAEAKGISSTVSGRVDILVTPDIEAGNLLVRTLSTLCMTPLANVVVGGKVPVVLWSPEEDADARLVGLALGVLCS